jgi:hypothetical protein
MAFVCNQCHRTWPDKDNQIEPDEDLERNRDGVCPECHEEEADDPRGGFFG